MPITRPSLAAALAAIGNANLYISSDYAVGTWTSLGAKDGPVRFNPQYRYNNLVAEELTGGIPHQTRVMLDSVTITVPLILGSTDLETLWPSISPDGGSGGGHSTPQAAAEQAVALIPDDEVGAGLTFDGTTWAPAAPTNAVWLWRCYRSPGEVSYQEDNGGKLVTEITFTGMYAGANPEGHKVYTIGDPDAAGVTMLVV